MALVTRNLSEVADSWWTHLIRGLAALAVGIFMVISPTAATQTLAILISCWLIADGVINIASALIKKDPKKALWVPITIGSLSIIGGILLLVFKNYAIFISLIVIGAWAVIIGAYAVVVSIRLRKLINSESTLPITGGLSIALGLLMVLAPLLKWIEEFRVVGIFVIIEGALLVMVALRLVSLRGPIRRFTADKAAAKAADAITKAQKAAQDAAFARELSRQAQDLETEAANLKEAASYAEAKRASLEAEKARVAADELNPPAVTVDDSDKPLDGQVL